MNSESGMKRAHNSALGFDDREKIPRLNPNKLRFLIFGHYAAAMIGKDGANLKRLMDTHRVRITGLQGKAAERILELEGPRPNAFNALRELIPACPGAKYPSWDGLSNFSINLLVNSSIAGNVIGKKGWRYDDICRKTGIKLKVYPECLPNSTERVVAIGGQHLEVLMQGLDMILQILDVSEVKSETTFFKPSEDGALPEPIDLMKRNGGDSGIDLNSIPGLLVDQRDLKLSSECDLSKEFGFVKTTTELSVPNGLVGVIIGTGGDNITYVKRVSGAFIEFTKSEAGGQNRKVILTGSQYQVQIAEQLMSQCIRMNNAEKLKKSSKGRARRL